VLISARQLPLRHATCGQLALWCRLHYRTEGTGHEHETDSEERQAQPPPQKDHQSSEEFAGDSGSELQTLPAIYRTAIVLCDLEGKSIKQAAQQLGCPAGTLGARLVRGRSLLARRLTRRQWFFPVPARALLVQTLLMRVCRRC